MHLKRIDITGFKSFADKTTIEFVDGVTAVVGPNGSGKSNITEAIRWVLGETSAKSLRGGRMNDVIFAGSESRKPLNFAEVTLVLENEDHFLPLDFSEISITRRLNRNGDSDFYLNKQSCRLKDIVDLFMDSGLGKESFSIISQGKVEAIFNSKPEDRRSIFEEAAGVLKYKTRKKKAEQKLFETEDNLNRVQDIVYELEDQVEPLREQSSIAKDYLSQKEQLSEVEIALTVVEIDLLKEKWQASQKELSQYQRELATIRDQLKHNEQSVGELREKRQQLDSELDRTQALLVTIIQQYEQTEASKKVLSERSKNTKENLEQFQQNKAKIEAKISQLNQQHEEIKERIAVKQEEEKKLKADLLQAEKERNMLLEDSAYTIETLRDDYVEWMQKQTTLRNEQSYLEKSFLHSSQKNKQSDEAGKRLEEELTEAIAKKAAVTEQLKTIQQDLATKLLNHQELQTEYQKNQGTLEIYERNMFDAMRLVQQAKAKRDSLSDLNEDYAGFYQGVREVLKRKTEIGGVIGAVAEVINVPKQTELAIDIALGAQSQNVIVKDEESGRKGITYLKQKRLGRATFLPLTTIKPRQLPSSVEATVRNNAGFIGIASELVDYPAEVATVIQNLLGTTIIAEDLTSANAIARLIQFKYRVVTLDGDVMNAGGSMTGGASKKGNQGSIFARKNELATLNQQIEAMEKTLNEKEIEVRSLKQALKKAEHHLEELRMAGEQKRLEEQQLKNDCELYSEKERRLSRELKAHSFEFQEAKEEADHYHSRTAEIKAEMLLIEDEMKKINHQIDMLSSENEKRTLLQKEASEKVQQLTATVAVVKEQLAGSRKEQANLLEAIQQEEENVNGIQLQIQAIDENNGNHQLTKEELEVKVASLLSEKETLEGQMLAGKEKRSIMEAEIDELDRSIAEQNNQQHIVLEQKSKAEVTMNRQDVEIENRLNHLSEEYGLSFEFAKANHSLTITLEEARQKVKLLKLGIEELGSVNLGAIEEFDRVNERFTFLTEQRDDLLTAKSSLFETMDEMDEEVKKRFSEVFEAIREKFSDVFPKMFGGGYAELRLSDPSDLLNTGIEIIAQPPGKKLQNLSLLSGGERAFTAIALLFSIIQVRPVPFCILDEVEAALDEANVARFGRYLNQFEGDTQFIVITHRKGTMEEADVLYGVTMQETGVSRIVSVRLEEIAETGEITTTS
ncbi:chromosome segregation protein SMC [Carnobacterium divergens]|uniref:chromosome segregation protein SMC n=1 Tax=Carnobacterium divergens TaxID=2748 RepID=UPI0010724752|nr:chromosome segregation protein SMC [Carnobacterium divergens]MDT1996400.1 chromosome segregation protein SMC [Carnobacterium divergens]TFI62748.1 chromosome segregation protein SMC [Carnobacterium divergens]TFI63099.1 chromosome segregation protein SMC [Carnobacterium divergens]TFI67184.1 chromosome segregation protein SMC [Carnobacterium divergens]TFI78093.1 chromosome segregation protein SMC [Carnobacterium divergens]